MSALGHECKALHLYGHVWLVMNWALRNRGLLFLLDFIDFDQIPREILLISIEFRVS